VHKTTAAAHRWQKHGKGDSDMKMSFGELVPELTPEIPPPSLAVSLDHSSMKNSPFKEQCCF